MVHEDETTDLKIYVFCCCFALVVVVVVGVVVAAAAVVVCVCVRAYVRACVRLSMGRNVKSTKPNKTWGWGWGLGGGGGGWGRATFFQALDTKTT